MLFFCHWLSPSLELRFNFHADFQRIRRIGNDDIAFVEAVEDDDAAVFFIASQDGTGIGQAAVIDDVNEVTAVFGPDRRLGNLFLSFRRRASILTMPNGESIFPGGSI